MSRGGLVSGFSTGVSGQSRGSSFNRAQSSVVRDWGGGLSGRGAAGSGVVGTEASKAKSQGCEGTKDGEGCADTERSRGLQKVACGEAGSGVRPGVVGVEAMPLVGLFVSLPLK